MTNDKITRAAELMAAAWREKRHVRDFPADLRPATRAEAYAIQDKMAALLGFEVIGWKLGMTSTNALKKMEPVPGRMFAPFFAQSPATMRKVDFVDPFIEPEFAFRLTADVAPRKEPYTREVMAAIAVLHMAIEVAGVRVPQPQFDGLMMIADDGGNAAFIAGPIVPNWAKIELRKVPSYLEFDGVRAAETLTGDDRCDPLGILVWLANDLSKRGIALLKGSWVSTGSGTKPTALGSHSRAVAVFEGIGKVELTLA
jgi:2-keto-4-pentenoate hydratase